MRARRPRQSEVYLKWNFDPREVDRSLDLPLGSDGDMIDIEHREWHRMFLDARGHADARFDGNRGAAGMEAMKLQASAAAQKAILRSSFMLFAFGWWTKKNPPPGGDGLWVGRALGRLRCVVVVQTLRRGCQPLTQNSTAHHRPITLRRCLELLKSAPLPLSVV
ncbi:hypothetical protein [Rhizobium sp. LjRoot258]|uniref:hypothetical protein n=1 Tax=Rhizobium sp. LjRoot258 TaxID=3342299 RepID=UPI003ECD1C70